MPEERRIDAGPVMAALGGLLLLVSLFLDWFERRDGETLNAWRTFEALDLLLAGLALAAVLALAALFARSFPFRPRSLLPLGALAFVVVVSQLLNEPPLAGEESSVEAGAWLALAGAALMLAGAILGFARVSLAVAPREDGVATPAAPAASAPPAATQAETEPLPGDAQRDAETSPLVDTPEPRRPQRPAS